MAVLQKNLTSSMFLCGLPCEESLLISLVSDTIRAWIADCYNSVLHQLGSDWSPTFTRRTFPAGSERMQAETEDYLVEWRGCVAQLVNLISPVACFSEVFGILVLKRMLFSSLSFIFPVSKDDPGFIIVSLQPFVVAVIPSLCAQLVMTINGKSMAF